MSLVMREGGKRRQKNALRSIPFQKVSCMEMLPRAARVLNCGRWRKEKEEEEREREREASPMSIVSYRVDIFGMGF